MNNIIKCIKSQWKKKSLKICFFLIPLTLILGCTHSCIANQELIKTLDRHQQFLNLIQDSINANEFYAKSDQDSLTRTIKQIITPHNIDNNSINMHKEELLKEIKEISKEIQSLGKLFFDSNTVTYLITLIVTILLTLFFESQKEMKELTEKTTNDLNRLTNNMDLRQKELTEKTTNDLNRLTNNMDLRQKELTEKTTNDINTLTNNMDLYVQVFALHNTTITIHQFLTLYYLQQTNIELFPELVYQATNSIKDIKNLLKYEFVIRKDLSNMMYKTLDSAKINLTLRKEQKGEKVKESEDKKDIKILLSKLIEEIYELQIELWRHTII